MQDVNTGEIDEEDDYSGDEFEYEESVGQDSLPLPGAESTGSTGKDTSDLASRQELQKATGEEDVYSSKFVPQEAALQKAPVVDVAATWSHVHRRLQESAASGRLGEVLAHRRTPFRIARQDVAKRLREAAGNGKLVGALARVRKGSRDPRSNAGKGNGHSVTALRALAKSQLRGALDGGQLNAAFQKVHQSKQPEGRSADSAACALRAMVHRHLVAAVRDGQLAQSLQRRRWSAPKMAASAREQDQGALKAAVLTDLRSAAHYGILASALHRHATAATPDRFGDVRRDILNSLQRSTGNGSLVAALRRYMSCASKEPAHERVKDLRLTVEVKLREATESGELQRALSTARGGHTMPPATRLEGLRQQVFRQLVDATADGTLTAALPKQKKDVFGLRRQVLGQLIDATADGTLMAALPKPKKDVDGLRRQVLGQLIDATADGTLTAALPRPKPENDTDGLRRQILGQLLDATADGTLSNALRKHPRKVDETKEGRLGDAPSRKVEVMDEVRKRAAFRLTCAAETGMFQDAIETVIQRHSAPAKAMYTTRCTSAASLSEQAGSMDARLERWVTKQKHPTRVQEERESLNDLRRNASFTLHAAAETGRFQTAVDTVMQRHNKPARDAHHTRQAVAAVLADTASSIDRKLERWIARRLDIDPSLQPRGAGIDTQSQQSQEEWVRQRVAFALERVAETGEFLRAVERVAIRSSVPVRDLYEARNKTADVLRQRFTDVSDLDQRLQRGVGLSESEGPVKAADAPVGCGVAPPDRPRPQNQPRRPQMQNQQQRTYQLQNSQQPRLSPSPDSVTGFTSPLEMMPAPPEGCRKRPDPRCRQYKSSGLHASSQRRRHLPPLADTARHASVESSDDLHVHAAPAPPLPQEAQILAGQRVPPPSKAQATSSGRSGGVKLPPVVSCAPMPPSGAPPNRRHGSARPGARQAGKLFDGLFTLRNEGRWEGGSGNETSPKGTSAAAEGVSGVGESMAVTLPGIVRGEPCDPARGLPQEFELSARLNLDRARRIYAVLNEKCVTKGSGHRSRSSARKSQRRNGQGEAVREVQPAASDMNRSPDEVF
eukprot:TRINITY_DN1688_c0_g1_i1.p1 TRINITY_DN1688_c0_g1~~TRINITY_DN1688_c0_g1_i1.p1  ORF type:complete len:1070 (-),score=136.79 TRINITY_DN1688_c0_g1_i1:91-3300(-)